MNDLFSSLMLKPQLISAFEKVKGNHGAPGGDGVSIASFARSLNRNVTALAASLRDGDYRPLPLRPVDIPKRDGGLRRLMIPSVRDRVVQTAVAQLLNPVLDPLFSPDSFAYRSGKSVDMAVRRVNLYYREGFPFVAEADIRRCFDTIPHDPMIALVDKTLGQSNALLTDLIAHWIEQWGAELGSPGQGLAQGSPLAPLLANLYLDQLDDALDELNIRFVRFADDFVLLARTEAAAHNALGDAAGILRKHGLEIVGDKTNVTAFDDGFDFLGHMFLRSMVLKQVVDPDDNPNEQLSATETPTDTDDTRGPDRFRVLYLNTPGRHLTLKNMAFSVTQEDSQIMAVHHSQVDRIEIGPRISVDMPALRLALGTDTALDIVDGHGRSAGQLLAPNYHRAALHLAQARISLDPELAFVAARCLVDARLRNQRAQLHRLNRKPRDAEVISALVALGRTIRKVPHVNTVEQLRGLEGAAAALYWPSLGRLCAGVQGTFRRQRPAKTPLNAAINYLTYLLARDIRVAINRAGLHPGFGTLHSVRDRNEALIYDLMEVFRAPLSEGLPVTLFNQNRLRLDMFDGPRMTREGVRAVIIGYEAALERRITYRNRKQSWRDVMLAEARAYGQHCTDPDGVSLSPIILDY